MFNRYDDEDSTLKIRHSWFDRFLTILTLVAMVYGYHRFHSEHERALEAQRAENARVEASVRAENDRSEAENRRQIEGVQRWMTDLVNATRRDQGLPAIQIAPLPQPEPQPDTNTESTPVDPNAQP